MSDKTVEKLNIQVSADAQRASRALDRLSSSLLGMDKAVKRLNNSGFSKISTTLNSFSNSISKLDGIEIPDLSEAVQSLEKLGNIKVSDNGINKTVNALTRLFRADLSGFNPENFQKITESISALGNMPDVSSSVNRFVSSLSRLANAGEKTGQSANEVLRLGEQTRLAAQKLKSVGGINEDVNLFVQSIGRLASAGAKTSQTASGLNSLAKETLEFFKAMQNAPKVSENTIRMTQALAQLASAGGKVGTSTNTITSAFNKLSSVGSKTMSVMRKVASGITSAFKQIGNSSSGLTKAQFSLGNLLKTAIGFRLGYGLLNFGKQAFELGSAITEVENVVDVAFGDMADKAYEFASTAKEQFGLSELAAKQYSGTMMAMLNASGVSRDAAAEMSTTLAGLAGDLASFYNIETDEAFYKLRSAIAGEVEPMRQLGVSMTVANLQAYALSQGITKSWQSMTQAEQAMLRYNYILSATGAQQGDYQRTLGSFANQWRLLTLNIQTLASTIGQGLIAAVLPAVQALNALMAVLQKAAEAFRDFMYVLTGYTGEGAQSGVVNEFAGLGDASSDLEDIGSSGDDAAYGLEGATEAVQDLEKALSVLSFDELNQLGSSGASAGELFAGISSDGGLDSIAVSIPTVSDFGTGSIFDSLNNSDVETPINRWADRIRNAFVDRDWDKLGEEIAWGLNKGFQFIYDAINWKKVGPKITKFTTAFTKTFNSLVDKLDFKLIGKTVGAGINTIVNTFNQLLEGIKWKKLGKKLADGVNGLFDEVNWENLGKLLGKSFQAVWDLFGNFVGNLDFAKIGSSVAKGLNGVFSKISFGDIANYLATALNGAFTTLEAFTADFEWDELVENISNGIITFIEEFEWEENAGKLSDFLVNLLGALKDLSAKIPWSELGEKIGTFLGGIDWFGIFGSVFEIIKNVVGGFIDGFGETTAGKFVIAFGVIKAAIAGANLISSISDTFSKIKKIASNFVSQIGDKFSAIGGNISGVFSVLSSHPYAAIAGGIAAVAGAAVVMIQSGFFTDDATKKALENADQVIEKAQNVSGSVGDMTTNYEKSMGSIKAKEQVLRDTADRFFKLKSQVDKTPIEMQEFQNAYGLLTENLPGFDKIVDDTTLTFQDQKKAVQDLITETTNLAKTQAAQEFLDEYYKKALDLKIAQKEIDNAVEELGISQKEFAYLTGTIIDNVIYPFDETMWKANELKAEQNKLNQETQDLKDTYEAAMQTFDECGMSIDETNQSIFDTEGSTNIANVSMADLRNALGLTQEEFDKLNGITQEFDDKVNQTSTVPMQTALNDAQESAQDLGGAVKDAADSTGSNIDRINNQTSTVPMQTALNDAQESAQDLGGAVKDAADSAGLNIDSINNLNLNRFVKTVVEGVGTVKKSFGEIKLPQIRVTTKNLQVANDLFSIPQFSLDWETPSFSKFARGGLVSGPTYAVIGETFQKEAVLPLENKRTMSMIANSILDNASAGMGLSTEEVRQAVTEGVVVAMMNNQQNPINVTVYSELRTESDEVLARAVTRGQNKIDYRTNPTPQFT